MILIEKRFSWSFHYLFSAFKVIPRWLLCMHVLHLLSCLTSLSASVLSFLCKMMIEGMGCTIILTQHHHNIPSFPCHYHDHRHRKGKRWLRLKEMMVWEEVVPCLYYILKLLNPSLFVQNNCRVILLFGTSVQRLPFFSITCSVVREIVCEKKTEVSNEENENEQIDFQKR
jgi:hypothetical protein